MSSRIITRVAGPFFAAAIAASCVGFAAASAASAATAPAPAVTHSTNSADPDTGPGNLPWT
jgi:hypothetical protein